MKIEKEQSKPHLEKSTQPNPDLFRLSLEEITGKELSDEEVDFLDEFLSGNLNKEEESEE